MAIIAPNTTAEIDPSRLAKIKQQAEEFEGVFLNILTKQMFSSLKTESDFGGGFGEETWRSMQAEQLAATMAQNGGLGIADQLMGDLIALQEKAGASAPSLKTSLGAYSR